MTSDISSLAVMIFEQSCRTAVLVIAILLLRMVIGNRIPPAWRHALWGLVPIQLLLFVSIQSPLSVFNFFPDTNVTRGKTKTMQVGFDAHGIKHLVDEPSVMYGQNNEPKTLQSELFEPGTTTAHIDNESEAMYNSSVSELVQSTNQNAYVSEMAQGKNEPEVQSDKTSEPNTAVVAPVLTQNVTPKIVPNVAQNTALNVASNVAPRHGFGVFVPKSWSALFVGVWLAGSVVMITVFLRQIFICRYWLTLGKQVTKERVLTVFEECCQQMKVKTWLVIAESDIVCGPFLIGAVRPTLLLPKSMIETASANQLQTVFLHELAHLKRWDIWTSWLMTLLLIVHWFNPFLWLAIRRMNADREEACDVMAIETLDKPQRSDYAHSLLDIAQQFVTPAQTPGFAGISKTGKFLTRRIDMIKQVGTWKPRWKYLTIGLALLMAATTLTDAQEKPAPPKTVEQLQAEIDRLQAEVKNLKETKQQPLPPLLTQAPSQSPVSKDIKNLRQLTLAVHNYHDVYNSLPSASTVNSLGKPMHSWRVALLPYLEHADLYEKIKKNEPWDSEYNKQFHNQMPDIYRSPFLAGDNAKKGLTLYSVVIGNRTSDHPSNSASGAGGSMGGGMMGSSDMPGGGMGGGMGMAGGGTMGSGGSMGGGVNTAFPQEPVFLGANYWPSFGSISDGTSNTILFVERAKAVCWMDPNSDVPFEEALKPFDASDDGIASLFDSKEGKRLTLVAMVDGSIQFLSECEPNQKKTLLTCQGGEGTDKSILKTASEYVRELPNQYPIVIKEKTEKNEKNDSITVPPVPTYQFQNMPPKFFLTEEGEPLPDSVLPSEIRELAGKYVGTEGDDRIGFVLVPMRAATAESVAETTAEGKTVYKQKNKKSFILRVNAYEDGLPGDGWEVDDDWFRGVAAPVNENELEIIMTSHYDGYFDPYSEDDIRRQERPVPKALERITAKIIRDGNKITLEIPKNSEWDKVRVTKIVEK